MPVTDGFTSFVLEQLDPLGPLTPKRMFGGVGIYAGDLFFALIAGDVLYLKADDATRAARENAGARPFSPPANRPKGKGSNRYYSVPAAILEDGDALLDSFRERAAAMRRTIDDARAAGVPVVYVNDERGRWTSDAPQLVRDAVEGRGGDVIELVKPRAGDAVLLKHRYSAFDHTPLDILLASLDVDRVVLVGAATEGCVVQTAIDAREHGLAASIVVDACATTDPGLEATALDYAARVVGVRLERSFLATGPG